MRCTAKSKQSGKQCKRSACKGSSKCSIHGGGPTSGRPPETGRWSKYAPKRLVPTIEEALNDSELITLRQQMAMLDSLAVQRLSELGEDPPERLWAEVLFAIDKFPAALEAMKGSIGPLATDEMAASLEGLSQWHKNLSEFLQRGKRAEKAETELREIIQEQTRVARQEVRREKALQEGVTLRQLNVLMSLILDSINRHVADTTVRRAIQGDLVRAIGSGDR